MREIRDRRGRRPISVLRLRFLSVCLALLMSSGVLSGCGGKKPETGAGAGGRDRIIENKGSDTLVNLALAWAEACMEEHPEVSISVTGGGSGTGIAAMINGTVSIANASREMKPEEIAAAKANGVSPVEFVVAHDAIAVVVSPSNPVQCLSHTADFRHLHRRDQKLDGGWGREQADRAAVKGVQFRNLCLFS